MRASESLAPSAFCSITSLYCTDARSKTDERAHSTVKAPVDDAPRLQRTPDSLDLILAVDALTPPLTGIGRYAYELCQGVGQHPQVRRLRCFSIGRWVEPPDPADWGAAATVTSGAHLRRALAANRLAVRAYHLVEPRLARWRLRHESDALFHSPNYFLPPFPGRSVATVHDLSHLLFPEFHPPARVDYINRAFPDSLRRADHLITDAESVRREVIERCNWPPERITAVPLGADPSFHPRANEELQPVLQKFGLRRRGYSLFVGTVEPRKNVDRLLAAYEALPAALRREFPLVIAGARGWHSADTHARMAGAVAAGWLRYLSYVPQTELPLLYSGARLFAYPSLYEGFGLPVLEAMASGVPVLTSNRSSLPEVVGDTARLVDPESVDEIAAALARILADDGWLDSAGAAGLARAKRFTWEHCVERTVAVYRQTRSSR